MAANVWEKSCELIKENIDDRSYKNWFLQTKFLAYEDSRLHVGVPSQFFADWLNDHYLEVIHASVSRVEPACKDVLFLPAPDETFTPPRKADGGKPAAKARSLKFGGTRLNPKYNFDTFVVGSGNRFAHAASLAVADLPAKAYNPLFLYGGVGLGKTHLMQAVGHYIMNRNSNLTVVYMSSEEFTNPFDRRHPFHCRQGEHTRGAFPHVQRTVRRPQTGRIVERQTAEGDTDPRGATRVEVRVGTCNGHPASRHGNQGRHTSKEG